MRVIRKLNFTLLPMLLLLSVQMVSWQMTWGLSDKRLCADPDCKKLISTGRTSVRYSAPDESLVSFGINQQVRIYSKSAGNDPSLWGIEVAGRRGYAPKSFIVEEKVLVKKDLVKHEVPVVLLSKKIQPALIPSESNETESTTTTPLEIATNVGENLQEPAIDSKPLTEQVTPVQNVTQISDESKISAVETSILTDKLTSEAKQTFVDDENGAEDQDDEKSSIENEKPSLIIHEIASEALDLTNIISEFETEPITVETESENVLIDKKKSEKQTQEPIKSQIYTTSDNAQNLVNVEADADLKLVEDLQKANVEVLNVDKATERLNILQENDENEKLTSVVSEKKFGSTENIKETTASPVTTESGFHDHFDYKHSVLDEPTTFASPVNTETEDSTLKTPQATETEETTAQVKNLASNQNNQLKENSQKEAVQPIQQQEEAQSQIILKPMQQELPTQPSAQEHHTKELNSTQQTEELEPNLNLEVESESKFELKEKHQEPIQQEDELKAIKQQQVDQLQQVEDKQLEKDKQEEEKQQDKQQQETPQQQHQEPKQQQHQEQEIPQQQLQEPQQHQEQEQEIPQQQLQEPQQQPENQPPKQENLPQQQEEKTQQQQTHQVNPQHQQENQPPTPENQPQQQDESKQQHQIQKQQHEHEKEQHLTEQIKESNVENVSEIPVSNMTEMLTSEKNELSEIALESVTETTQIKPELPSNEYTAQTVVSPKVPEVVGLDTIPTLSSTVQPNWQTSEQIYNPAHYGNIDPNEFYRRQQELASSQSQRPTNPVVTESQETLSHIKEEEENKAETKTEFEETLREIKEEEENKAETKTAADLSESIVEEAGEGSVESLTATVTTSAEEPPITSPSKTSSPQLAADEHKEGLFATILGTVNSFISSEKKEIPKTLDDELQRILYPEQLVAVPQEECKFLYIKGSFH